MSRTRARTQKKKVTAATDEGSHVRSWSPRHLSSEGPRYLAVVDALERDIQEGRLLDGHRLPPHRELALHLGLSIGTVSKAYQQAELRGIASGHVGQGTFVRRAPARVDTMGESESINLALNVPPIGSEASVLSAALSEIARQRYLAPLLDYHPHGGITKHREVIASFISREGLSVKAERVFLCNGAQHAIDIALRLVNARCSDIMVESLTYSGFKALAAGNTQQLLPIAMDDEGVIPEVLEATAKRTKARVLYTMPTLQSPTARTMSVSRRQAIAEIAERLELWIIEDDVYGFFHVSRPPALAQLAPDRCIYLTSYSKCVAPGFRLGALVVPYNFIQQVDLLLHGSTWFVTPLLTEVASRMIQTGKLDELISERRRQAIDRYNVFTSVFPHTEKLKYPPFFGWLPLPPQWNAASFANAAQRIGIQVTPPVASLVDVTDPHAVRICLGAPKELGQLASALRLLKQVVEKKPSDVLSVA